MSFLNSGELRPSVFRSSRMGHHAESVSAGLSVGYQGGSASLLNWLGQGVCIGGTLWSSIEYMQHISENGARSSPSLLGHVSNMVLFKILLIN